MTINDRKSRLYNTTTQFIFSIPEKHHSLHHICRLMPLSKEIGDSQLPIALASNKSPFQNQALGELGVRRRNTFVNTGLPSRNANTGLASVAGESDNPNRLSTIQASMSVGSGSVLSLLEDASTLLVPCAKSNTDVLGTYASMLLDFELAQDVVPPTAPIN